MTMTYLPQELIRKKRDGLVLSDAEIVFMVQGITSGQLSDAQLGAFAMAVFQRGMTMPERVTLTQQMMCSGKVLNWQNMDLDGPVVDKHSTGGVGDKVSLMLGPIVAACGAYVPMISGRGLGHTGGTLDKFDSIPGYDAHPDEQSFKSLVKQVGCAIIGQTAELAPADQRLYATRDVTATVESIDLITASILSKKLAASLDALVMDVKTGNGAFAAEMSMAQVLSQSISQVATGAGVPTRCLITDMNQVLGRSVGNAVEMMECIEFLLNPAQADERLVDLTLELAAHMLDLSGVADNLNDAKDKASAALNQGRAAQVFARMVAGLGGPPDLLEKPQHYLPQAPIVKPILASHSGYVCAMDVRAIGLSLVTLKAGRSKADDAIDYAVGLSGMVQIGDYIEQGQPLAVAHVRNDNQLALINQELVNLIQLAPDAPRLEPLVKEIYQA
ncbi:MAG: thymidine phosphorylase [Oceanospirillaceae bacterium]|jgi:thymidine phosphorylase|nr:thymidine phosphorylase [Oceanospirillaceae bacterium]MBT7674944.1 thymidine phosphorylase [Oceanospirillaceae bacterium]MDC1352460.1 thymidine phosphorylase [Oceanospirillaceae bacterium]MDO7575228.1 thymidine phosphorylase [Oceanospirillaceae bacterium]MDO7584461.1 thymidine phosphorylase [Oceanospirillaceae bacterium]